MLTQDVMTREVAVVHTQSTVLEAVEKMVNLHVSGLPVVDEKGVVAGILSEGDLLRRVELETIPHHSNFLSFLRGPGLAALDYVKTHTLTVEDIMTRDVVTVGPEAALSEVVGVMERSHVRRVPVVESGRLVGIVSRSDLVRALLAHLLKVVPEAPGDEKIRTAIIAEVNRQHWHSLCTVKVAVRDGRVTLSGVAQSEPVYRALRVAAEAVQGVKTVDNQVSLLDPMLTAMGA